MEHLLMDPLSRAHSPAALSGINISSVSLAATYSDQYAAILKITYTFPAGAAVDSEPMLGVNQSAYSRPADTITNIIRVGMAPSDIEDAVLTTAWRLGAWDVRRIEKAPLADPSKMMEPRYGLSSDFGINPYIINDQPMAIGLGADIDTIREAAIDGYVTWHFVPLHFASQIAHKRWGGKDKTLNLNLTREGEPKIGRQTWARPREPLTAHEHIYQLGRHNHGNRSKKNLARRG